MVDCFIEETENIRTSIHEVATDTILKRSTPASQKKV
jgi:hypothetical protein